jgi:hypothetical protein
MSIAATIFRRIYNEPPFLPAPLLVDRHGVRGGCSLCADDVEVIMIGLLALVAAVCFSHLAILHICSIIFRKPRPRYRVTRQVIYMERKR